MKFNWKKNHKISKEEIRNIDKKTYIEQLNYLTEGLEERIRIRFPNPKKCNEYLKLLNDIKIKIKEIENSIYFEIDDLKIIFLNSILELRRKIYSLKISEKTEVFMKYINTHDIPTQNSNIRFYDADDNIFDDALIEKWYTRQLYSNLEKFKLELEKYKDIYPNAYQKICQKIESLPKTKKITNIFRRKVEIFMEILETNKISLPIKNAKLTFNDFDFEINSNSNIKIWFHNVVNYDYDNFLIVCSENSQKFPKANQIIIEYLANREIIKLDNESRTKLWLSYLETNQESKNDNNLTFIDIDQTCLEQISVLSWIYKQLVNNLDEFNEYLEKYKELYPIGYIKVKKRISDFLKKRRKRELTDLEKEKIFMNYINKNEIPSCKSNLLFKDLIPNCTCECIVYGWYMSNIMINRKHVIELIYKYETEYPYACKRLLNRINQLEERRKESPIKVAFQEKTAIFMKYVEKNKIPSDWCKFRFCDIDPNTQDTTLVGNWFRDQLSKNLNRFYFEVSKYKEIYPNAYLKITNRINNSNAMIKKQRKLLLGVLNKINNTTQKI